MDELDQLTRALGLDPDSPKQKLGDALAEGDLNLLDALVRLRVSKGLTQQDVADAMKRDKSAVSRFEALESDPRISTIRRYARAIGALVEHEVSDFEGEATEERPNTSMWKNDPLSDKNANFIAVMIGDKVSEYKITKPVNVYRQSRRRTLPKKNLSEGHVSTFDFNESGMK